MLQRKTIVYVFRPALDSMILERSRINGISTARQIRVDSQLRDVVSAYVRFTHEIGLVAEP